MSNAIIIELCAEDRARLDRLTAALEGATPNSKSCAETVARVMKGTTTAEAPKTAAEATEATTPPVTQPEKEAPAEAEKTAQEAPKTTTPPVTQPEEETPTETKNEPEETAKPTVTLAQIQQKVVQLAAGFGGSKKAAVREIVNAYAKRVSDLPEDKWTEVWDKLTALESEG